MSELWRHLLFVPTLMAIVKPLKANFFLTSPARCSFHLHVSNNWVIVSRKNWINFVEHKKRSKQNPSDTRVMSFMHILRALNPTAGFLFRLVWVRRIRETKLLILKVDRNQVKTLIMVYVPTEVGCGFKHSVKQDSPGLIRLVPMRFGIASIASRRSKETSSFSFSQSTKLMKKFFKLTSTCSLFTLFRSETMEFLSSKSHKPIPNTSDPRI